MLISAALQAYRPSQEPIAALERPRVVDTPRHGHDRAEISPTGRALLAHDEALTAGAAASSGEPDASARDTQRPNQAPADTQRVNGRELTPQQVQEMKQLKMRDREVRAHEQAHQSVGGPYAGSASFTYQSGPDGQRYAVGGEVPIDVGAAQSPEETIRKMERVRRAALAPAEPSAADRAIAAQASAQLVQAQLELAQTRSQGETTETEPGEAQQLGKTPNPSTTGNAEEP